MIAMPNIAPRKMIDLSADSSCPPHSPSRGHLPAASRKMSAMLMFVKLYCTPRFATLLATSERHAPLASSALEGGSASELTLGSARDVYGAIRGARPE